MANKYIEDKEEFENIIKSEYVDPKVDKLKKIDELNHWVEDLKRKQDALYDDKFNNIISVEIIYYGNEADTLYLANPKLNSK